MISFVIALTWGFLRGLEHALDADHLTTIATLATRSRSFLQSVFLGLWWGIGHTITVLLTGVAILMLRVRFPERWSLCFEFLVGGVLILLGTQVIFDFFRLRIHAHLHPDGADDHFHFHSHLLSEGHDHRHDTKALFIGMLHGLAGTAALSLALLSTFDSLAVGLLYLAIFSLGTIIGMLLCSGLVGIPFVLAHRRVSKLAEGLRLTAGLASVSLGLFLFVGSLALMMKGLH